MEQELSITIIYALHPDALRPLLYFIRQRKSWNIVDVQKEVFSHFGFKVSCNGVFLLKYDDTKASKLGVTN